jgi:ribonuclease P protein subunit RPR2
MVGVGVAKHQKFDRMKRQRQEIAARRIERLMALADERGKAHDLKHASRYASLARSIGMRYNVRLRPSEKLRVCKGCGAYLLPGITLRARMGRRTVTRTCLECGFVRRTPLRRR